MTVAAHNLTATIHPPAGEPIALSIIDGTVTVDDSWSPYVQATILCWTPENLNVLEQIDPRADGLTVSVRTEAQYVGTRPNNSRDYTLLLRARTIDHSTGTMSLRLSSAEMLLQDKALTAMTPERIYGLNVTDAVEYALTKIGAQLAPGAATANVVTDELPPVATNLVANSSFETSAAGWSYGGNVQDGSGTVSRPVGTAYSGDRLARLTFSGTTSLPPVDGLGAGLYTDFTEGYVAGETYSFAAYVRASKNMPMVLAVEWRTATAAIRTDTSAVTVIGAQGWTRVVLESSRVPDATTVARMKFYSVNVAGYTAWNPGDTLDLDAILAVQGSEALPYFDGSTVEPLYTFEWTGTPHASPSTRTARPNTDAMIWNPGVTAWDWLTPLLTSTGLRLYCNAAAEWILTTRDAFTSGQVNVSPTNGMTGAADDVDRDDDEWFDSVVIKYAGDVYDIANPSGRKTRVYDWSDRAIPAFGGAAQILTRAGGYGRTYGIQAISDYNAEPGKQLVLSVPGQISSAGTVRSVEWTFPDGTMSIGSRGLVETDQSEAWLFAPLANTWATTPDVAWAAYTN